MTSTSSPGPADRPPVIGTFADLAGARLPETALVQGAIDLAWECSEPWLFNHVMRTWLFATHAGVRRSATYDAEMLAVAATLHDLGLTAAHPGPFRFEVNGANAARSFIEAAAPQVQPARRQLVWDSIALHSTGSIAQHKEPEVALLNAGVGTDYAGDGLDQMDPSVVSAILTRFPRRHMKTAFTDCLCHLARTRTASTYGTWVADFGARFVEDYAPPSAVDRLYAAPFEE